MHRLIKNSTRWQDKRLEEQCSASLYFSSNIIVILDIQFVFMTIALTGEQGSLTATKSSPALIKHPKISFEAAAAVYSIITVLPMWRIKY